MLRVEPTYKTPEIIFDDEKGTLLLVGRSIPENPVAFYKSLIDQVEVYLKKPKENTSVRIRLDYLNTHSTEIIILLFKQLQEAKDKTNISINWEVEEYDEDMKTLGEDMRNMFQLPIHIEEFPEEE